ncbi:alpha/beta hydrolase family protein [Paremcibacter congregatus]|uniref:Peptidase S9 prolyl oligopeptidase catalytic domain-containing protein n=1 Tax=Paremcibacter congregatus TaxID=2043170 RepID=A0A2G4YNR8_9PROT|nr:S9 family peptidase [Paremcibacter congregatus]PHZ83972.1 hypothetical protein CRD36_14265 [Paremcibacter congregatus]QDE25935.1 S9 family peptidase [Paremcibacter congregatus]
MSRISSLFLYVVCLGLTVFALLGSAARATETGGAISAEAFGDLPNFRLIKLSPTGKRVASLQNYQGGYVLVTQSFDKAESDAVYVSAYKGYEIESVRWVNDHRLIVTVGWTERDGFLRYRMSRIVAMNWDKSNSIQLLKRDLKSQFHSDVISMLPDDPDHILMGVDRSKTNYPDVYKVNVNTGSMKRQVRSRASVRDWWADGKGVVRMGMGMYKLRNRLIFRNSADDSWRTLAKYDVIKDDVPFTMAGFTEVPHVIYVSKLDEKGRKAFYRYDTEQEEFLEKIAGHDTVDVSELIINDKGGLDGYRYLDEMPHTVYRNSLYKALQKMLKKNFPYKQVQMVSKSRDEKKFIIKVMAPDLPGDLYFLNLETKELYKFNETHAMLASSKLSPMEMISYTARDGLAISGYLSLPRGVDRETAKNIPMVILPHGGPFARDSYGFDYWVQFLTTRGYGVLQMNYRGSEGYGTVFEALGHHEWGRKMLEDINDGTKWAIEQGFADADRICIMGGSYGGYAALQAVVKDPTLYKCSVAFAAVTDVSRMMQDDRHFLDYRRWQYYIRNDDLGFADISPINHVDKLNVPILLVHGTEDVRVRYDHSKAMAQKLKRARKSFKFVTLKDGDHHLSNQKDRIKFLQEVEKFLAKNL